MMKHSAAHRNTTQRNSMTRMLYLPRGAYCSLNATKKKEKNRDLSGTDLSPSGFFGFFLVELVVSVPVSRVDFISDYICFYVNSTYIC